jgi:hypothetical protein
MPISTGMKEGEAHKAVKAAYASNNEGGKQKDINGRMYREVYEKFGHAAMVRDCMTINSWSVKEVHEGAGDVRLCWSGWKPYEEINTNRRNEMDKVTLTCEVKGDTFDWLRAQAKAGRMTMGQALDLLVALEQDNERSEAMFALRGESKLYASDDEVQLLLGGRLDKVISRFVSTGFSITAAEGAIKAGLTDPQLLAQLLGHLEADAEMVRKLNEVTEKK